MFRKSDQTQRSTQRPTLQLSGSALSNLSPKDLQDLFKSIPSSVTTLDLSTVSPAVAQDVQQRLSNAGISGEPQERPQTGPK